MTERNTRLAYTTEKCPPASPVRVFNPRDAAYLTLAGFPMQRVVIQGQDERGISAGTAVFYFDHAAWDALKRFRQALNSIRADEMRARQERITD